MTDTVSEIKVPTRASDARFMFAPIPQNLMDGGRRNSRYRSSSQLAEQSLGRLILAVGYSIETRKYLNRHITLHFGKMGISGADVMPALSRYFKLARDYSRRLGYDLAWVWVRENGENGDHVHILMTVPDALSRKFLTMSRKWLSRACDAPYVRGGQRTRKVAGWSTRTSQPSPTYFENLKALVAYLAKQCSSQTRFRQQQIAKGRKSLPVIGKRSGHSENLGEATRRKLHLIKHVGVHP